MADATIESGGTGGGSNTVILGLQSEVITRLPLEAYSVTDAFDDPVTAGAISAAPTVDALYVLTDAVPVYVMWFYSVTRAAWKGVQFA